MTIKIHPQKDEYCSLSNQYNLIPVYAEILGDTHSVISLFQKLRKGRYQFLLESAVSGEHMGRYSFMGSSDSIIICSNGIVSLVKDGNTVEKEELSNPLEFARKYFEKTVAYTNPELPPFVNGAVGYIGYDTVRYFEKIDMTKQKETGDRDFALMLADSMAVYDNLSHRLYLVSSLRINEGDDPQEIYSRSVRQIESMVDSITRAAEPAVPFTVKGGPGYKSNYSKESFEKSVEKVKDYIYAGDIFQLVLSQRLRVPVSGDSFNLYRSLRIINPSPYMFYLKYDDVEVIGSSPEIHVQLNEGRVNIRPIAGTRPRGKTQEEDRELEKDLLSDEKELAEHIMLVDLARNDIGRVCTGGTVRTEDLKVVEYYSHVMHIVSNVTGRLSGEYDMFDLIKATFPAGTVSGAPKIRAMEIISSLEPDRRGIYSGLIGYFSYNGNFDSCITIRTFVVKNGNLYLQAGAGIVADSVPEKEYYETIHKMRVLTKAVELSGEIK